MSMQCKQGNRRGRAVWHRAPLEVFTLLLVEVVGRTVKDARKGDAAALDWLTHHVPELLDLAGLDVQRFRARVAQLADAGSGRR